MRKLILSLCVGVFSLAMVVGDAEARRLGGGKSLGMQRGSVAQKPATPPAQQQNAAAPAATPQPAPTTQPKRNWLGPIAGLAAGLGIAALLSHFGFGEGMANFVMIALLVMAAVFVVRLLFARKSVPAGADRGDPLQYAGVGGPGMAPQSPVMPSAWGEQTPAQGAGGAGAAPALVRNIPADFDSEAFARVAKLNFLRLQAANDARNFDDLREFLAPELFAEVKLEIEERGTAAQQTDVVSLNAEVLEVVAEPTRHVASVRFSGMIREEANGESSPFDEVWNLVKPIDGSRGWQVAGIQQLV